MEQINQFAFYELGKELVALRRISAETKHNDAFFILMNARNALGRILNDNKFTLQFCRPSAEDIWNKLGAVLERDYFDNGKIRDNIQWTDKIDYWNIWHVINSFESFEHVLQVELGQSATYFANKKGIFESSDLVDNAHHYIPEDLRRLLPEIALNDFRAAGRCLAFSLPTACGFHAMRAVEGSLAGYCENLTGEDVANATWGDLTAKLEKHRKDNPTAKHPSRKLIEGTDKLRGFERNDLMHPRTSLTEWDAQRLFAEAVAALILIATERTQISTQRALDLEPQRVLENLPEPRSINGGAEIETEKEPA